MMSYRLRDRLVDLARHSVQKSQIHQQRGADHDREDGQQQVIDGERDECDPQCSHHQWGSEYGGPAPRRPSGEDEGLADVGDEVQGVGDEGGGYGLNRAQENPDR